MDTKGQKEEKKPSKRWNDVFNQRMGLLWMREAREGGK